MTSEVAPRRRRLLLLPQSPEVAKGASISTQRGRSGVRRQKGEVGSAGGRGSLDRTDGGRDQVRQNRVEQTLAIDVGQSVFEAIADWAIA